MSAKQIKCLRRWECEHRILELKNKISWLVNMGVVADRVRIELALVISQIKVVC